MSDIVMYRVQRAVILIRKPDAVLVESAFFMFRYAGNGTIHGIFGWSQSWKYEMKMYRVALFRLVHGIIRAFHGKFASC